MKKSFYFIFLPLILLSLTISFNACKKPQEHILPEVTIQVKKINQTDITLTVSAPGAYKVELCRDLINCAEKIPVNNTFEFTFANLNSNETYSFQATAFFTQGEKKSELIELTTRPAGLTLEAQSINLHEAILCAEIFCEQDLEYYFAYGKNSNNLDQKTTQKTGRGLIVQSISNLDWGSNYFFQIVLKIDNELFPGNIKSFRTLGSKPELQNFRFVCEDTLSMQVEFEFKGNLLPSVIHLKYFQEGTSSITLTKELNSTDTNWVSKSFTFPIKAGYRYFSQLTAENALGVSIIDSAINSPAFMYDGFLYHYVKIGQQDWIVENLRTHHYINGDPIPYITDDITWAQANTGYLCYYEHLPENLNDYGCLYNFYVIEDPRSICPPGWRVPTEDDFLELKSLVHVGELKEIGFDYWLPPNILANNAAGFSARGSGVREIIDVYPESFRGIKEDAVFYLNTTFSGFGASFRLSYKNGIYFFGFNNKTRGAAIRLVR